MVSPVPLPQHTCRLANLNSFENKQSGALVGGLL
jgi:hypothetical protein